MDGQHGGRQAAGLGSVSMMSALTTVFRPLVKAPVCAYLEAMGTIEDARVIPDILEFAEITRETAEDQKNYGALQGDPLSIDGIAFIMTYSAEATHPPLYKDMNAKCNDVDRGKIMPYGQFIVATVKHMAAIEPYPNDTVFRGVVADLRSDYPKGRKVTWHGFCSTTKSAEVLSREEFCGQSGKRTIFAIKLTQGQAREITRYSLVASEDEVLLPPGCRFEVESVLPQGDLTIIQMRELPSREWIVDLRKEAGGGGGAMAAPVSEQVALLQRKIEESSGTLRMLHGMGQTGAAITELQQQIARYQAQLATLGGGGGGAAMPVDGAAGPAGGGVGVVPAMASPHPSAETQAALAAQQAAEQKAARLAAQLQELQEQQQQAAAKQTVEAAARAVGLQIGARIYQQGSGGQIVDAEVVRYEGQKVVCRYPDGELSYVGNTVAEAAANVRHVHQLAEQQQKQKQKKKLTPAQQRQQAADEQREREQVARANGTTPDGSKLYEAASANNSARVNELLKQGAEVEWRHPNGMTVLAVACSAGSYEAAEALCAHGAELDARGNSQDTPLMSAAYRGRTKICEMLLALGADPSLKNTYGDTALDRARGNNKPECAALLQPVTPGA